MGTLHQPSGENISPQLRPTSIAVLKYLDSASDSSNIVSCPMLDIGLNIGRSVSSTRNAIDRLNEGGYIEKIRRGRSTAKGVYRVTELGVETLVSMGVQRPCNHTPPKPLSDMFRSPALGNLGQLYNVAPKEVGLTRKQVLEYGIVRSTSTLLKYIQVLSELPHPPITVELDSVVAGRKLYTFHRLESEAEQENLDYLQSIPGAAPKTHAEHELENDRRKRGFAEYLGGIIDNEHLYRTQVEPFTMTDPERPGCLIFTGELNDSGYGSIRHGRVHLTAHRIAWSALCGEILPGRDIHHWCGEGACVDTRHLDMMTKADHVAVHQGQPCGVYIPSFWKGKRPAVN